MGCAHKQNQDGFTLVEISIVMIIIGLLIGGTFGGMKLIENMQVNRTVQDLKATESAALTFKDTYGRLPGDIVNPSARIPNCTAAPCSTTGNGDRTIGTKNLWTLAITTTSENFTFWHHLSSADILSLSIQPLADLTFGVGQPEVAFGSGMRITDVSAVSVDGCRRWDRGTLLIQNTPDATITTTVPCAFLSGVDRKFDDGSPNSGTFHASPGGAVGGCSATVACDSPYSLTGTSFGNYDLRGF